MVERRANRSWKYRQSWVPQHLDGVDVDSLPFSYLEFLRDWPGKRGWQLGEVPWVSFCQAVSGWLGLLSVAMGSLSGRLGSVGGASVCITSSSSDRIIS